MKKILFRFDSGDGYGNGHLMRCLALADAFSEYEIYLVTNKVNGYYFSKWKKILKEFYLVENKNSDYNLIKNLCENLKIDYLVFDGYHLKKVFVYKRFNVKKVIYIDDEGFVSEKIDIIINQTSLKKTTEFKAKLLYGYKFFLCNSSLQKIKRSPKKSLLLSIGSSNDDIFLDKILTIFKNEKFKSRIYLTRNSNNLSYRNLDLNYISDDKLNEVYSEVSFAITAPGLMSLEMAFLNIPMIIYQTSIEQNDNIKFLIDNNFAYIIRKPEDVIQIIKNLKFLKPKVKLDSDGAYRIKKEILK